METSKIGSSLLGSASVAMVIYLAACSSGNDDNSPGIVQGDASTSDLKTPDASDASISAPIYPVKEGYMWRWQATVTSEGGGETFKEAPISTTIGESSQIEGRQAWAARDSWDWDNVYYLSFDDNNLYIYRQPEQWRPAFGAQPGEGKSWTDNGRTYIWRRADSVTVTAGTFKDCWRADANSTSAVAESYTIYCRGVGRVLSFVRKPNGYQHRLELIEKNF